MVRTILNRAARSYRDADGRPYLEALPPMITMLPENPRSPYPITWQIRRGRDVWGATGVYVWGATGVEDVTAASMSPKRRLGRVNN